MSKGITVIKWLFLIGALIFIYHFTMTPTASLGIGVAQPGSTVEHINLHPLVMIRDYHQANAGVFIINEIGNIVLFMPFGFFLPFFKPVRPFGWVVLIGMLLSISIETIQLTMPTRWTDIDDVILNTAGTVLGCLIFKVLYVLYRVVYWIISPKKSASHEAVE